MWRNLIRTLTTQATEVITPPIVVGGLIGSYATTLYSAASKTKSLDAVEKEVRTLRDAVKSDKAVEDFFKNPSLPRRYKAEKVREVCKKMNIGEVTCGVLVTMAEHSRLKRFAKVADAFQDMMDAHNGIVKCRIVSAKELSAENKQKLEASINRIMQEGQKMRLKVEINPDLIGGFTLQIGDRFVDMSIAHRIKMYEKILQRDEGFPQ